MTDASNIAATRTIVETLLGTLPADEVTDANRLNAELVAANALRHWENQRAAARRLATARYTPVLERMQMGDDR